MSVRDKVVTYFGLVNLLVFGFVGFYRKFHLAHTIVLKVKWTIQKQYNCITHCPYQLITIKAPVFFLVVFFLAPTGAP